MPDKNSPTPDSVLHSILARACDLRDGIALALSASERSDSQTKALTTVSSITSLFVVTTSRSPTCARRTAWKANHLQFVLS